MVFFLLILFPRHNAEGCSRRIVEMGAGRRYAVGGDSSAIFKTVPFGIISFLKL